LTINNATPNTVNTVDIGASSGKIKEAISAEELRELLRYDPDDGHLYWLKIGKGVSSARLDTPAGVIHRIKRYRIIGVRRRVYTAHRLIWLYVHGEWPDGEIDHIDGDRANNKITNLRDVSHKQNMANRCRHSNNMIGMKGVSWRPRDNRWRAQIWDAGKARHLGYFASAAEAKSAYDFAARALFGEFMRASS
jgi:hypothetical protein